MHDFWHDEGIATRVYTIAENFLYTQTVKLNCHNYNCTFKLNQKKTNFSLRKQVIKGIKYSNKKQHENTLLKNFPQNNCSMKF